MQTYGKPALMAPAALTAQGVNPVQDPEPSGNPDESAPAAWKAVWPLRVGLHEFMLNLARTNEFRSIHNVNLLAYLTAGEEYKDELTG